MEYRQLGRTDLNVSVLGFGCGAVGGLLINGEHKDMLRAVDRAVELGITYFDTAQSYGAGQSETNLGRVLQELGHPVLVGTKVQLAPEQLHDIEGAVIRAAETSLQRLRRDQLDLFQLHNTVVAERQLGGHGLTVAELEAVVAAFQKLQQQGKIHSWGINGIGETDALHQALSRVQTGTIQCCFNLLNPSAGKSVPSDFPYQDYRTLIDAAAARQIGVIAIRVLAGGALSGSAERRPNAARVVEPIASGRQYDDDVRQARRFQPLVQAGFVDSLIEVAIRFVIGKAEVATALIGLSDLEQLEQAVGAVNQGALPAEALELLHQIWSA